MDFDIHCNTEKATIEMPGGKHLVIPTSVTIKEAQVIGNSFAASLKMKGVAKARASVPKVVRKRQSQLNLAQKEDMIKKYWSNKTRPQYGTFASMLGKILKRRTFERDFAIAKKLSGKLYNLEKTERTASHGAMVYKWTPIRK